MTRKARTLTVQQHTEGTLLPYRVVDETTPGALRTVAAFNDIDDVTDYLNAAQRHGTCCINRHVHQLNN